MPQYDLSVVATVLTPPLACPALCGGCVFQVGVPVLSHLSAMPLEPLVLPAFACHSTSDTGLHTLPIALFARHVSQALSVHIY
jgi:hypothetical protein